MWVINNYINIKTTYSSVVYSGISLGISFKFLSEQSTIEPSQEHPDGHSLSTRHSPAYIVLNSSWPRSDL